MRTEYGIKDMDNRRSLGGSASIGTGEPHTEIVILIQKGGSLTGCVVDRATKYLNKAAAEFIKG